MIPPPPSSTLFPYTTLFRSIRHDHTLGNQAAVHQRLVRPVAAQQNAGSMAAPSIVARDRPGILRSEEHTSELQSLTNLVCRLLLEKKKKKKNYIITPLITH